MLLPVSRGLLLTLAAVRCLKHCGLASVYVSSVPEHTDSAYSYGWQQDETGAVPCGSREMSARYPEGAREDGTALSGSPRVSAVHTLWYSTPPDPGHSPHLEKPPLCHSGHPVKYVR